MGRGIATGPVPPEVVQQHFALRQDGQIVRRECRIAVTGSRTSDLLRPQWRRHGPDDVQRQDPASVGGARRLCDHQGSLADRTACQAQPSAEWQGFVAGSPRGSRYGADQGDERSARRQHSEAVGADRQSRIVRLGALGPVRRRWPRSFADVRTRAFVVFDRGREGACHERPAADR